MQAKKLAALILTAVMTLVCLPLGVAAAEERTAAFTDLTPGAWYEEGVNYVTERGIMEGTGDGTFAPDREMTRAELVTTLWRLAGKPETQAAASFADVLPAAWYTDAVSWASAEGIVSGYGGVQSGTFGVADPVTREQMCAILMRYAGAEDQGGAMGLAGYSDSAAISDWARPAVLWAVRTGLVSGREDGTLAPRVAVTRAELAKVLYTMETAAGITGDLRDDYTLDQVVVLSRHNIRSPLSGKGSVLGDATPHTWFEWTSGTSELSLRGGALETMMGQYFRKYLVSEGLFTENEVPAEGEVRFYANAKQRTIATARYFSAGMFPIAGAEIETHVPYDTMDPVFEPRLTYLTEPYREAALEQIAEMGGEKGLAGLGEGLKDSYDLISKVIDLPDSKAYADGTLTGFAADDTQISLNLYKEPGMTGSLKTATSISDALVLQYYEEPDPVKAAFGEELTFADWQKISAVKDFYGDVLFTAPLVAVNVANPLVREIETELNTDGRKFTFLCGHDSNVGSVLAALGAEDYTAPGAIEAKTPIGVKLVFEKWTKSGEGEDLVSVKLVYQSVDQLRDRSLLTLEAPPVTCPVRLQGLTPDSHGLYRFSDLMDRLDETIAAYDRLPETYGPMEQAA